MGASKISDNRHSQGDGGKAIQDNSKLHEKLPSRDIALAGRCPLSTNVTVAHCCPPGTEVLAAAGVAVAAVAGRCEASHATTSVICWSVIG